MNPEPAGQLIKAFIYGIISVFVSLCISIPFGSIGLYEPVPGNFRETVRISFFGAAIPEEIAKFVMLWLLLRKNRYFDEKMDGIVYAVCISLGFAALENVMYLFGNQESWLEVGLSRAIFAVPGHFMFAVLMGYYYSLARFYPHSPKTNKAMVLVVPIMAHGIYDVIAFSLDLLPALSAVMTLALVYFCFKMWKLASRKINELLRRDGLVA